MKPFSAVISILFAGLAIIAIPVPSRAEEAPQVKVKTIVIDPGHGGHDAGCISRDKKTYEKNLTLSISKKLKEKILKKYPDVRVIMTRDDDRYITLSDRADIANNNSADLFISVHINAQDGGTNANGYSIHCLGQSSRKGNDLFSKNLELCKRENSVIKLEDDYSTKYQGFDPSDTRSYILFSLVQNSNLERSLQFAEDVNAGMKGGAIQRSRGVSQDPFWVLWRTTMPAVLIECGFISNPSDLAALRSEQGIDNIACNILEAVTAYKSRYDFEAKKGKETVDEPSANSTPKDVKGEVLYGTQILATKKSMEQGDSFFAGYEPYCLKGENINRYFIGVSNDESQARKINSEIRKKFPDSFFVKLEGGKVIRVK